jgi:hypothetical protein
MASKPIYLWINKDQKNIKDRGYDCRVNSWINSFVQKQRKAHGKKRSSQIRCLNEG